MQNYKDNVCMDVSLAEENFAIFLVSLSSRCAHVLLRKKTKLINRFLYNFFLFYDDIANQLCYLTRDHTCKLSNDFKVGHSTSKNIYFIYFIERPLKLMKKAFFFIFIFFFIFSFSRYLSFSLFGHV